MKKLNKFILTGCLALTGMLSSCSVWDDFLTVYPTNQITGEQFWEDKNDLQSVVASCYKVMIDNNVTSRMLIWGEARSDNFQLNGSDQNLMDILNANLLTKNSYFDWSKFYTGIGYCNLVLGKGQEMVDDGRDPGFHDSDWKPIAAECRALRAIYYFYLVRAFRDVPFNISANDTSEGARNPMPQTSGTEIINFLINDLEACKDDAMTSFGEARKEFNCGRITRPAIYTLLADLYLWRACTDTTAAKTQAQHDYQKVIDLCDYVLAAKTQDFIAAKKAYYGSKRDGNKDPFPIYETERQGSRYVDLPYNEIFGEKNSLESIFELQFDRASNTNSTISSNFGYLNSRNEYSIGNFTGSTLVQSVDEQQDSKTVLYSKTDFRMNQAVVYTNSGGSEGATTAKIAKYVVSEIKDIAEIKDVTKTGTNDNLKVEIRSTMDCNRVLYRVSDAMLMKAEALAYLSQDGDEGLTEAFKLVNALYMRANPHLATETANQLKPEAYSTAAQMQELVMRERQREFFGEGKRWFDLVRMALRDGSTGNMLNLLVRKYTSNQNAIKAKLATINSLFNPVYENEMKINPALVQNPAWAVDETIIHNK